MIDVTDGFTSIEVSPNEVPHLVVIGYSTAAPRGRSSPRRNSTGARVTVEFFRRTPLPAATDIRVHYDFGGNGARREILGVPKLTHTTARELDGPIYHYRLSHWIPPLSIMEFVRT